MRGGNNNDNHKPPAPTRPSAEQLTHCVLTLRFPPRYAPIEDGAIDHRFSLTQAITTNEIHTV